MEMPRLSKSVRRVVLLQRTADGTVVPNVLYKAEGQKKKGTSNLRPLEKVVRRLARSQASFADAYLKKHTRSNQKRRDGWMKDLVSNVANAESKGRRALTKDSLRLPSMIRIN